LTLYTSTTTSGSDGATISWNTGLYINELGNIGIGTASPRTTLDVTGLIRAQGSVIPSSGVGLELYYTGNAGYINSYDRTNSVFQPLYMYGATIALMQGNVGIGTTSPGSYKLYVNGTAYSTGGWQSSDERWKKNISPLSGMLDIVKKLNPVSFEYRQSEYPDINFPSGTQIGFIAQDVESVLPQLVKEDGNGFKALAYANLTAVNTKALQQLASNLTYDATDTLSIQLGTNDHYEVYANRTEQITKISAIDTG